MGRISRARSRLIPSGPRGPIIDSRDRTLVGQVSYLLYSVQTVHGFEKKKTNADTCLAVNITLNVRNYCYLLK